jgi:hypothetical protein
VPVSLQIYVQHLPGVCELQRCIGDATSFREPTLLSPTNRFFAAADLSSPASFHALHEAVCVKGVLAKDQHDNNSDNHKEVVFDGAHRLTSTAESVHMLVRYYEHVLHSLHDLFHSQQHRRELQEQQQVAQKHRVKTLRGFNGHSEAVQAMPVPAAEVVVENVLREWQALDHPAESAMWTALAVSLSTPTPPTTTPTTTTKTTTISQLRQIPVRVCVVLESKPEKGDSGESGSDSDYATRNKQHTELLQTLQRMVTGQRQVEEHEQPTSSVETEIEVVLLSPSVSGEVFAVIESEMWSVRYFQSLDSDASRPVTAATGDVTVDMVVVARYLASFDVLIVSASHDSLASSSSLPSSTSLKRLWPSLEEVWRSLSTSSPTVWVVVASSLSKSSTLDALIIPPVWTVSLICVVVCIPCPFL